MACWTLGALPEFCSQKALLMVTVEAITLAEVSVTSGVDYNDILASKQPSVTMPKIPLVRPQGAALQTLTLLSS